MFLEIMARCIRMFAGRLAFAAAHRGKNTEDPTLEWEFESDPQSYHGNLRISTGLAILTAFIETTERAKEIDIPFKVLHGTGDRVTSYHGSERLYAEAISTDKEIQLFEGYEHVLLRKGKDAKDDVRRQIVLQSMLDWLGRLAHDEPRAPAGR